MCMTSFVKHLNFQFLEHMVRFLTIFGKRVIRT